MGKRDERRRQKALMRKRQKDKLRKKKSQSLFLSSSPLSTKARILQARKYPIYECLINSGWEEHGLADILLSRKQPDGKMVLGRYLVDRYCLGLKRTYCEANLLPSEYEEIKARWISKYESEKDVVECPVPLVHEIIYGAIDYASGLGFKPDKGFELSKYILDPEDKHPRTGEVEFGHEGKPLYISGPYDDVSSIMRQLEEKVGRGNFDFLIRLEKGELTSLSPLDLENLEIEEED